MLSLWLALHPVGLMALESMADHELSEESGAGLAFPFEQFSLSLSPTSFVELTGSVPTGTTTFIRGDFRYYGLSLSRGETGGNNTAAGTIWNSNVTDLAGGSCTGGTFGLGCPKSADYIQHYSDFDNPFMLRVFNYTGISPQGANGTTGVTDRPVLEILGPSNMDAFRWAFWGEVESGRTYGATASNGLLPINPVTSDACSAGTGTICLLQLQNIILGKPASQLKPPSVSSSLASNPYNGAILRFFQFYGTDTSGDPNTSPTYGIQYESRLSGNYRMSVNTTGGTVARGTMPDFTDEEGVYFMNTQAFLPLGQLHYQALMFDDSTPGGSTTAGTNGNVSIEITRIPNKANVYNDFYSMAATGTVNGYTYNTTNQGYRRDSRSDRYYQTHGYVEYGTAFPTSTYFNALSGSGASGVRFSGVDWDGASRTLSSVFGTSYTMAAITSSGLGYTVSSTNNGTGAPNCGSVTCNVLGTDTIGNKYSLPTGGTYTRDQVIAAGGMVFVSSSAASTWQVVNNQNSASTASPNTPMLMLNNTSSNGAGGSWNTTYRMQANPDYNNQTATNPTNVVNAINLGSSRIDGLLINHLKIKTLEGL